MNTNKDTKLKTEWDLGHIYKGDYKNLIKKDCDYTKKIYKQFANKYRKNKDHLKSSKALVKAIEEYEEIGKDPATSRPIFYYQYRLCLNSEDTEARMEISKLEDFYTEIINQIQFFILEIGKIPKDLQRNILKSKEIVPLKYFLTKVFENAKHTLSEAEERIMNLKWNTSRSMWVSGFEKLLNKQVISFENEELPIAKASALIPTLEKSKRRELHKLVMQKFKDIADFSESEINAIVSDKKVNDKLRGFKFPFESTVKNYENDMKTVDDLVSVVSQNFKIVHKFFKIKAKILKEDKLVYADRAVKIGEALIKLPFEKAVMQVVNSFSKVDKEFGDFVKDMFEKGLVDVFPKKGKSGGAFCSSSSGLPTYILLNHIDDFRSMTTLAHEMGHALHSKYSKNQRPIYEDYTIAVAEVASTFFENIVFDEALKFCTSEKEKMVLLHDKITDDISTIFRQIACFNFEKELHQKIRENGFMEKEEIAKLLNKHMQSYLGPIFDLTDLDGYFFVNWSHIRNFFYVYSYAFGQIISDALYERYKKDNKTIKDVIGFLSAGGSDSPENIFKKAGIKIDKKIFESGLKRVEENIEEFEKLYNKIQKNENKQKNK